MTPAAAAAAENDDDVFVAVVGCHPLMFSSRCAHIQWPNHPEKTTEQYV